MNRSSRRIIKLYYVRTGVLYFVYYDTYFYYASYIGTEVASKDWIFVIFVFIVFFVFLVFLVFIVSYVSVV